MGKVGRFACILAPMALTLAALVCLVLVFVGQQNQGNDLQTSLYFFRADTHNFRGDVDALKNANIDNVLLSALQEANSNQTLADFYQVGLFNYCEGNKTGNSFKVAHCSKHQSGFWFNPVDVWGLHNSTMEKLFPGSLQRGLNAYHKVAGWMFVAYVIALCATIAEVVVGGLAVFSRWGSLATTIVSGIASFFFLAAAITSTALYGVLAGAFDSAFHDKVNVTLGSRMLGVLWFGVACSIVAGFFWSISVCCCSGESRHKKTTAEKAGYTYQGGRGYERVPSPHGGAPGQHSVPMHNIPHAGRNTAYEPFRAHGGH